MNALDIIDKVRALDAELALEDNRLVVRGRGANLPDELQAELHAHKGEVMMALGAPHALAVANILDAIKPFLPRALKTLPDAQLLALVNWSIMHAWDQAGRRISSPERFEARA